MKVLILYNLIYIIAIGKELNRIIDFKILIDNKTTY